MQEIEWVGMGYIYIKTWDNTQYFKVESNKEKENDILCPEKKKTLFQKRRYTKLHTH